MKVDFDRVEEITGWPLGDVQALRTELAAQWAERLDVAGELADRARSALASVLSSPTISAAAATVSQIASVAAVWSAFTGALAADLSETAQINLRRLYTARDLSIASTYKIGAWWTVAEIQGPEDPTLVKAYKASVSGFTGQVSPPGFVYSAARGSGRRDVLRPSWLLAGGADGSGEQVYAGGGAQTLYQELRTLPPYKMAAGSTSCAGEGEKPCQFEDGDFPPRWKWLKRPAKWVCVPFDVSDGCAPPARAWWPYCLPVAPTWGYLGQRFPFCPLGQTLATAARSPSPVHVAIPSSLVLSSLYAIVTRTGVADLPEDPGQGGNGVFRRGCRLIFRGNMPGGGPPWADVWSPASGLQEGKLQIRAAGRDLQDVIDAHLDMLALRRALVLSMPGQTPEIRAAAAAATGDPLLMAAAAGEIPAELYNYNASDPLGAFADDGADLEDDGAGGVVRRGRRQGRQGEGAGEDGGGGLLLLGGGLAGAALIRWLARRRR